MLELVQTSDETISETSQNEHILANLIQGEMALKIVPVNILLPLSQWLVCNLIFSRYLIFGSKILWKTSFETVSSAVWYEKSIEILGMSSHMNRNKNKHAPYLNMSFTYNKRIHASCLRQCAILSSQTNQTRHGLSCLSVTAFSNY